MSILFEPSEINGMSLKNRFVRSATWEGMATNEGACTPKLIECMLQLADGGIGLIISSHAFVREDGQAGPWQLGIYRDEFIDGYKKLTTAVHDHGSKIVMQLTHAGFFADPKLINQAPLAMSDVKGFAKSPRREMSNDEIENLIYAYVLGAQRAKESGFDGIQLHAAHGYFLSQTISPAFNKRNDEYGGSLEKRAKCMLDIISGIKKSIGPDLPILIKMNCQDFMEGGLSLNDSVLTAAMLQEAGLHAIEISGGTPLSGKLGPTRVGIKSEEKEAFFRQAAKAFKEKLSIPIILVGGNRSFQLSEKLLNEGYADYISFCRPLIREPDLIKRWKSGDLSKSTCISDNKCIGPASAGEGIYCVIQRKKDKMEDNNKKERPNWIDEIEIAGDQLVSKVKEILKEGNVRRLIIKKSDGVTLLEIPLSAGIAVGGVATIFSPILVALGAMAALIASFKIEVVRREDDDVESE